MAFHTGSLGGRVAGSLVLVAGTSLMGSQAMASDAPTTLLVVPNLLQAKVPSTLVAVVTSGPGQPSPAGTVTFETGYGGTLGTAPVVPSSNGSASATLTWTAPPESTVPLIAKFTPDEAVSPSSVSAIERPAITTAPVPVALRFTPRPKAGPITLEAVLGHEFGPGSVSFFVDGRGLTNSVMTVDGVASVEWQATAGVHTVLAQYSSSATSSHGFSLQTGSSTQVVNVLP